MAKTRLFSEFTPILVTPFFALEKASNVGDLPGEPYYRLTERDSAICCVLDQSDHFVFIKQYRPSLEELTIETPAGGIEDGETPLDAARRELTEEVGIVCPLLPLGNYFRLMMNRVTSKEYLFFGMFPESCSNALIESGIETVKISRRNVRSMALTGAYQQLAGVGLMSLAGEVMQVDIWRDPLEKLESAFRSNKLVQWTDGR
jgi:ADP-ribose pyrophosphatase YjhB (NUDIX family)